MQNEYIKEKEKSGSLVPYMKSNTKQITGIYKFIPSSSGLRPLYLTKYIKIYLINVRSMLFPYATNKY